ncbi:Uncharacterised protein [Bordetella pertussis]|nr:Uncharacterised protein [Bordetella pertussis]
MLAAQLDAGQQAVFEPAGGERALGLEDVVKMPGAQVLLPALALHQPGLGAPAGQIGVVEIAMQPERRQGMAQLPSIGRPVAQARAQHLDPIVDIVAPGVAVDGRAPDRRGPAVHRGNAAVGHAVVAAVFVLRQPIEPWRNAPRQGGRRQAAARADPVPETARILAAHVQAQADRVGRVRAQVGVQAAKVLAAQPDFEGGSAARPGRLAHPIDDAALAAAAVQNAGRPLEHLDALDVVQVAHVLAVIAHPVQVEVAAGVEPAYAQAVEAGIAGVGDIGHAGQRLAQRARAIVQGVRHLHGVDRLRHLPQRCGGTGGGAAFEYPRIVGIVADDRDGRQFSRRGPARRGKGACQRHGGQRRDQG